MKLYRKVVTYQTTSMLHLYMSDLLPLIRNKIINDDELLILWLSLFSHDGEITDSSDDDNNQAILDEINVSMQMDLYNLVTYHFIKIGHNELLLSFKETVAKKKKKQALRPSLQSKSGKSDFGQPSTSQSSHNLTSDSICLCGICKKECIEDPHKLEENSIGCDKCSGWYHYPCVNLTGSEPCITKKRAKWYCPSCTKTPPIKRSRKSKK